MESRHGLLIDDDPIAAVYVRDLLGARGIAIDHVARLDLAEQRRAQCSYGFYLVDRRLPDGDGLSWLQDRLQADPRLSPEAFLLLSGDLATPASLPPGVQQLCKPVDAQQLLDWVLGQRHSSPQPTPAPHGATAPLLADAEALARLGGRMVALQQLRLMLLGELRDAGPWLLSLGDDATAPATLAKLHRLRAASALTGCPRLAAMAADLEALLRQAQTPGTMAVEQFRHCVSATISALEDCR